MTMPTPIRARLQCMHEGCTTTTTFEVFPTDAHGGTGYNPPHGWVFFALGHPHGRPNLGICPEHQEIVIADTPPHTNVLAKYEPNRGLHLEFMSMGVSLGKASVATNTLAVQPMPPGFHDRLTRTSRKAALRFRLSPDNRIVDDLMAPTAKPQIKRGGPHGHGGSWIVEIDYTTPDGTMEKVLLSEPQRVAWRAR